MWVQLLCGKSLYLPLNLAMNLKLLYKIKSLKNTGFLQKMQFKNTTVPFLSLLHKRCSSRTPFLAITSLNL